MIDIIVCSYGPESQKFLDDCLLSIQRQTYKDKKVYVVSSGDYKPQINCSLDVIHKHYLGRMHFPEAVNEGVKLGTSPYILLCNDDIIMQKDCLKNMLLELQKYPNLIINPTSNCDNGKSFNETIGFKLREFIHVFEANQYLHKDISPHYVNEIIDNMQLFSKPTNAFVPVQFAAFYCTLMSRKTWNDVGGIDTKLKTGQDDLDFCLRAREKNIHSMIFFGAFCFHFSGATANIHLTKEDRMFNIDHFNQKWLGKVSIPQIK